MNKFDWNLFWTAFSAIGTMLACIIALFVPILEKHLVYKRKLKMTMNIESYFATISNQDFYEKVCTIHIINKSCIDIKVSKIGLYLDGMYYSWTYTLPSPFYVNPPFELKPGEATDYYIPMSLIADQLNKRLISNTKNFSIVVSDSYGKKYMKKTNITIDDIKKEMKIIPKLQKEE